MCRPRRQGANGPRERTSRAKRRDSVNNQSAFRQLAFFTAHRDRDVVSLAHERSEQGEQECGGCGAKIDISSSADSADTGRIGRRTHSQISRGARTTGRFATSATCDNATAHLPKAGRASACSAIWLTASAAYNPAAGIAANGRTSANKENGESKEHRSES